MGKHKESYSAEYKTWIGMRGRCSNPRTTHFDRYGGRGIKVCERWDDFCNFLLDMGRKPTEYHTIDRFPDKNGNYEPGNCRWATRKEQANNRTNNPRWEHRVRNALGRFT